jgi:hypothetical protein
MATNYLYIDDDKNAHGIVKNIENDQLNFTAEFPLTWNEQIESLIDSQKLNSYDGLLLDLKLEFTTKENDNGDSKEDIDKKKMIKFSGADLAQTIRTSTKSDKGIIDLPIFLCSTDNLYISYFDRTSIDLFDRKLNKTIDFDKKDSTRRLFIDYSDAYKVLNNSNKLEDYIGKEIQNDEELNILSAELEKCMTSHEKNYLLDRYFIRESGSLIDEKLLAIRLGIDITTSPNWNTFKDEVLGDFKYKGILSRVKDRWWNSDMLAYFKDSQQINLKILDAAERVAGISSKFPGYSLRALPLLDNHEFTTYWYKCELTDNPLDILDGLRTIEMPRYPWIDPKYVSKNYLLSEERDMKLINSLLGPNERLILSELE